MFKLLYILLSIFILSACGVEDSGDETDGISSSDHRIFVTSQSFNGNLGGIGGADTICANAAANAGLERRYAAIVSSFASGAKARLNITGNVFIFSNSDTPELVASSGNSFWGTDLGSLNSSIDRDEFFNLVSANVWTGTGSEGAPITTNSICNNWTSSSSSQVAFSGNSTSVLSDWVENITAPCSSFFRLYCISL